MNETTERINANYEFLEGVVAADQALIAALKQQRQELRETVEMLLNCVDPNRDWDEAKKARQVLRDTRI
jgi:hypothetical protein